MAENNKPSIFHGFKNVGNPVPVPTTTNNQNQLNSETMTSTETNNNSVSSTQPMSFSFNGSKAGSSSPQLASLANATEPTNFSFNSQQPPVATFKQRLSGETGNPTTNNGEAPFNFSFGQTSSTSGSTQPFQFVKTSPTQSSTAPFVNQSSTSGSNQTFQFTKTSSTESSTAPFGNQSSTNVPRFSFANLPTGNPSNLTFNQQSPGNSSQVRQPMGSFPITFSTQKQEPANNNRQQKQEPANNNRQQKQELRNHNLQQNSIVSDSSKSTTNKNTFIVSQRLSDPPTPTSEQSSGPNQDQEEVDTPASLAERSLLSKKLNTTLRDLNTFIVDRNDVNSPLHPLASFEELNLKPELLKGIYNMGFKSPSKIQAIALPNLLGNPPRNIIAQSQSGTGKTAAFSLAIISHIDPSVQSPQVLILAPTFELAIQIGSVIEKMAQFLPYIQVAYAVRGQNCGRGQLLTEPIVIGTPGTLEDWCKKKRVIDLRTIRMCCVDEADVMIATEGFQRTCVELVRGLNTSNCQMMLFSATYSDDVMGFAREIVNNPIVLRLKREKQALDNIRQFFVRCYDPQHKYYAIEQIYSQLTVGQAMIFCRTKATARDLAIKMAEQQHSVRELTAALDIEQRASIIQQFRDGVFRVLISTNVTARGLDIDDVSLVINYDMPVTVDFKPDYETYLHRIGRCGRFGKLGYTFNLIGSEKDYNTMKEIECYFNHAIDEITIEGIGHLEHEDDQK